MNGNLIEIHEDGIDDEAFARKLQEQFMTEGLNRSKNNEGVDDMEFAQALQHASMPCILEKNSQTNDDEAYARMIQENLWKSSPTLGTRHELIESNEQRRTSGGGQDRSNAPGRIDRERISVTTANPGFGLNPTVNRLTGCPMSTAPNVDAPTTVGQPQRVDDYRIRNSQESSPYKTKDTNHVSPSFLRSTASPKRLNDHLSSKNSPRQENETVPTSALTNSFTFSIEDSDDFQLSSKATDRSLRNKIYDVSKNKVLPKAIPSFLNRSKKASSRFTSGRKLFGKKTVKSITQIGRRSIPVHSIPQAEHRGITLRQLRNIAYDIKCRCVGEEWTSTDSNYNDHVLQPDEVTFYDLVENHIKPNTKGPKCSYVETIANQEQTPEWFVSHWWGQPVLDFIKCIEMHTFDGGRGINTTFWISAFAIDQNTSAKESTPEERSQRERILTKTMSLTKGIVSIIDSNSVYFSRLWCNFEISVATNMFSGTSTEKRYSHDIYTLINDGTETKAVGLTDGFVSSDKYKTDTDGNLNSSKPFRENRWILNQANRQSAFPIALYRDALDIEIESCQASRLEDKWWILNYITGTTQDHKIPPTFHKAYSITNALLGGKLASLVYRHALEAGEDMVRFRKALRKARLESMFCSFSYSEAFVSEAFFFANSLPISLKVLALEYDAIPFHSSDQFALGFARLKNLTSFKLRLNDCTNLSSLDLLWHVIAELEDLKELRIRATRNEQLTSIRGIGSALAKLTALNTLLLDFSGCTSVSPSTAMEIMVAIPLTLERLVLNLRRCPMSSFNDIFESIGHFTNLRYLRLAFCDPKLSNIDKLGASLANLHELQSLHLDFSACQEISSISQIILGLSHLDNLSSINFNFENCSIPVRDRYDFEDEDCLGLSKLTNLDNLTFRGPLPSIFVERRAPPGKTLYPSTSTIDRRARQVVSEIGNNDLDGNERIANLRWLNSEICFLIAVDNGLYDAISRVFADDAARSIQERLKSTTFCWLWPIFHGPLGKGHRNANGKRCYEFIKSSPMAWVNWIEAATSLAVVFRFTPGSISGKWEIIQNIWAFTISALSDPNVGQALVCDTAPLEYTARRMKAILPRKKPKDPIGEIVLSMMYQVTAMITIWCNLLKPTSDFEGMLGLEEGRKIQYDSALEIASTVLGNAL